MAAGASTGAPIEASGATASGAGSTGLRPRPRPAGFVAGSEAGGVEGGAGAATEAAAGAASARTRTALLPKRPLVSSITVTVSASSATPSFWAATLRASSTDFAESSTDCIVR